MRETIKYTGKTQDGYAHYEDSDLDGIYAYDSNGKAEGLKEGISPKKYHAEKIRRPNEN